MLKSAHFKPPALGAGIIFVPGLEASISSRSDLFDVVEVEAQTFWLPSRTNPAELRFQREALELLQSFPQKKLVHGVGFPVGGTICPRAEHVREMASNIESLQAPWCSEHLAFNQVRLANDELFTGFFLPPLQTAEGVAAAVANVRQVAAALPVPFAIETAVNYLKPKSWEIPDGEFVRAVCEGADCGVLLDLHNLWANEKNGRQSVREFLEQLPLDRVWEIHLAGGEEMEGYWLDAHCGRIPEPLYELTADLVPALKNLGAIIFEVMPMRVPELGEAGVANEMERVHKLWALRRPAQGRGGVRLVSDVLLKNGNGTPSLPEWERGFATLVTGYSCTEVPDDLQGDAAVPIFQRLIEDIRAGALVDNFRLTIRLLHLNGGDEFVKSLLRDFWRTHPPRQWAHQEAKEFARFLEGRNLSIKYLPEVTNFERARLETLLTGRSHVVHFHTSPFQLLQALGERRLPGDLLPQEIDLEITPD